MKPKLYSTFSSIQVSKKRNSQFSLTAISSLIRSSLSVIPSCRTMSHRCSPRFRSPNSQFHKTKQALKATSFIIQPFLSIRQFLHASPPLHSSKSLQMTSAPDSVCVCMSNPRHLVGNPLLVKQASSQARAMASKIQRVGVVDVATTIMNSMYSKCEPVAEQYALSTWRWLNRLPIFPQVAQIVIPTAACWSEKYNQLVRCTEERGYPMATYLPLIPTERIAKVFDQRPTPTVPIDGEIDTVSAQ